MAEYPPYDHRGQYGYVPNAPFNYGIPGPGPGTGPDLGGGNPAMNLGGGSHTGHAYPPVEASAGLQLQQHPSGIPQFANFWNQSQNSLVAQPIPPPPNLQMAAYIPPPPIQAPYPPPYLPIPRSYSPSGAPSNLIPYTPTPYMSPPEVLRTHDGSNIYPGGMIEANPLDTSRGFTSTFQSVSGAGIPFSAPHSAGFQVASEALPTSAPARALAPAPAPAPALVVPAVASEFSVVKPSPQVPISPFVMSQVTLVPKQHNQPSHDARLNQTQSTAMKAKSTALHNDAIDAIKSFHQHGISYKQLEMEGIFDGKDKALLRELFEQAGIQVEQNETRKDAISEKALAPLVGVVRTASGPSLASNASKLPTQAKAELPKNSNSPKPSIGGGVTTGSPSTRSKKPLQPTTSTTPKSPTKQTQTTQPPKPAASTTSREAYLARLQAAKSKKSLSAPSQPSKPPTANPESKPTTTTISSKATSHDATGGAEDKPSASARSVGGIDAAKTELVRQRLQALTKLNSASVKIAPNISEPVKSTLETPSRTSSSFSIEYSDREESLIPETAAFKSVPCESESPPEVHSDEKKASSPEQTSRAIPGLFMTDPVPGSHEMEVEGPEKMKIVISDVETGEITGDTPRTSSASSIVVDKQISFNQKKRPLSTDFMGPDSRYQKRPFTHHRPIEPEERCVIELSDDDSESEDSDTEVAAEQDSNRSPNLKAIFGAPPRPAAMRNQSGYVNPTFGSTFAGLNRGSSVSNSAAPTPPTASTPDAHTEQLKRKEEEIASEKRKLAEKIAQMQLRKKAKLLGSGTQTPLSPMKDQPSSPANIAAVMNIVVPAPFPSEPPATLTKQTGGSDRLASADLARPVPPTSDHLREAKRRRQAELEADVLSNQSRMQELMKEMARLEEENRQKVRDRDGLATEPESMEIDTEGMSHADLKATKAEMDLQKWDEATVDSSMESFQSKEPSPPAQSSDESEARPEDNQVITANQDDTDIMDDVSEEGEVPSPPQEQENLRRDIALPDVRGGAGSPHSGGPTSYHPLQPQFEPQPDERPQLPLVEEVESAEESMDDIYGSDSNTGIAEQGGVSLAAGETANSPFSRESTDDDVMSLSLTSSESEDGEVKVSADAEADEESDIRKEKDEGDDDYEPAPADISLFPKGVSEVQRLTEVPIFQQTWPEVGIPSLEPAPRTDPNSGPSNSSPDMIADDLALELRPWTVDGEAAPSTAVDKIASSFTSYESPLKLFKAFRFHPEYPSAASQGFSSVTYSHNIDVDRPMCQFETAGGVCNDPQCESQHFRDMQLTDGKVLLQLGTTNTGNTAEEKRAWSDGIKSVIKDLGSQNVRDSEAVAAKIVEFRREFLKDSSKILNL